MTTIITGTKPKIEAKHFSYACKYGNISASTDAAIRRRYSIPPEATVEEVPILRYDTIEIIYRWFEVTL